MPVTYSEIRFSKGEVTFTFNFAHVDFAEPVKVTVAYMRSMYRRNVHLFNIMQSIKL